MEDDGIKVDVKPVYKNVKKRNILNNRNWLGE